MLFILRRLGYYLIAFWASLTINFLLPRLMPGDPVGRMLGQMQGNLTDAQIEQFRHLFGLDDRPVWLQYIQYIGDVFTGQLGISISQFPVPVVTVIGSQIGWTILLGGTALIIAVVVGNLLGVVAAWRRGGVLDSLFPPLLVFVGSFPYFFIAMVALYLFAVTLKWFPIGQAFTLGTVPSFSGEFIGDVIWHLVLPAGTIVAVSLGGAEEGAMDGFLSERGLARESDMFDRSALPASIRLRMLLPHALAVPSLLRSSDMLALLPSPLAALFAQRDGLLSVPTPYAARSRTVQAIWHTRADDDPAQQWLRSQLV